MGRYINTALGQRWTDEPYPDEPSRRHYPARTLQALGRIAMKVDQLVEMEAAKLAPPAPPKPPEDPRVVTLARAMGHQDFHLPRGSQVSLTWDDEAGEIVATGLTLEGRFFSISDIVKLQLIDHRGAWLWHRYSQIAMALPPVTDAYLRPHFAASVAGRPSL
jgi:hypothetical protein